MATEDETFDPNDLDSIDALLDEAELEVAENIAEDPIPEPDSLNLDDMDLSELTDDLAGSEVEEDVLPDPVTEVPEENLLEDVLEDVVVPPVVEKPQQPAKSMVEPEEEFVSKRAKSAKSNKTSPNELSVADMDSIKKLVIIFGSVLIVLVLTAIGMGVWSALAASGGLDEETQGIIEDIQANTVTNTMSNTANTKVMESVEKKLDALSFQLEQLTADIATLEDAAKSTTAPVVPIITPILDAHGKPVADTHKTNTAITPVVAHAVTPQAAPVTDQVVLEKLSVVSSKMVKAQSRIDEVNRRVKDIQSQYGKLMHSVKVVEKQLVDQQAKSLKEEKESAQSNQGRTPSTYQYNSSNAMHYDQANPDSYP